VEALFIHNDDGRDRKNRFFGSLEPLKDLTELTHLNIANTDIDSGLEYLPDSLQTLNCSVTKPGVKVKTIEDFLVDEEVKILEEEIDGVP
jgi:hypothetical protein